MTIFWNNDRKSEGLQYLWIKFLKYWTHKALRTDDTDVDRHVIVKRVGGCGIDASGLGQGTAADICEQRTNFQVPFFAIPW